MIGYIRNLLTQLRHDEHGLTAVEYAVLGGLIVAALATVIGPAFVGELTTAFGNLIP